MQGYPDLSRIRRFLEDDVNRSLHMNQTIYPVKDAAARLGISVWTLRKKAYEGEIDSIKIGAKLLIPESEIARLIQEGMRPRRTV